MSAVDEVGWSIPLPCHFTPREKEAVPVVQEADWAPRQVWTGVEKRKYLATTRVQNPKHQDGIAQSLYQLLCSGCSSFSFINSYLVLQVMKMSFT
jgi:hypothetical protein